jgi:S1-C subfamily serine protease
MEQGQAVFMYGNPNNINDLLRRGYVVGGDAERTLLDLNVSHGDSGAGVFNDKGEVVGVITGFGQFSSGMRLALVKPFTKPVSEWAVVIEE